MGKHKETLEDDSDNGSSGRNNGGSGSNNGGFGSGIRSIGSLVTGREDKEEADAADTAKAPEAADTAEAPEAAEREDERVILPFLSPIFLFLARGMSSSSSELSESGA